MNKNSVKYLKDIRLSQLTPLEKTEIKNSGRANPVRRFSTLRRVKTFLRSLMSQGRPSALAMLSMERRMSILLTSKIK
jgi:hypothetical protein